MLHEKINISKLKKFFCFHSAYLKDVKLHEVTITTIYCCVCNTVRYNIV